MLQTSLLLMKSLNKTETPIFLSVVCSLFPKAIFLTFIFLSGKRHATIVSAYAPTMTNPDEVKDKFYDDLDSVISAAPRTDKLILLGDFNARVGTDHQT